MFVFYRPIKDWNWIKTISNFCEPLWNRCNEKGCITWIKDIHKEKLVNFKYEEIKEKEINFWLFDIFWKYFNFEKEQETWNQTWYFENSKFKENYKIIDLEKYKQWKFKKELEKINKWFDETIKNYIKTYPEMEVQTWGIKLAEAEKVLAWQDSPYLQQLAQDKWLDVNELAKKIKAKADVYNAMYSKLEAEKDKQIKDLKDNK